ncbi:MAG: hypothetical protein AAF614_22375, partial [Chloroflexota bacterium]
MKKRDGYLTQASDILQQAEQIVDNSLAYFAQVCGENGRLSTAKLDQHQPALYEIAYKATQLLAARPFITYAQTASGDLP